MNIIHKQALCMHGQCLLSLTYSLPHVYKNTVIFYYSHAVLHTIAMSACSIVLSVFIMKCMLKFPYLNYLKSLTSQFSTFVKDLLARRNLYTVASMASGLEAKWCWLHNDEAQDAVFCFICVLSRWYSYLCTYGQLQLQHWHMC